MAIPIGYNAFTWARKQASTIGLQSQRAQFIYEDLWASMTTAQKNGVKNSINNTIDSVVSELNSLKTDVNNL